MGPKACSSELAGRLGLSKKSELLSVRERDAPRAQADTKTASHSILGYCPYHPLGRGENGGFFP